MSKTDAECTLAFDKRFDPIVWGRHAWATFYYLAARIESIPDETEKRRIQQQLVEWIEYLIPCRECTHHYREKRTNIAWKEWIKRNPNDSLVRWFQHVRFEIEQDMWNMRSETISKSILVHEYQGRKATSDQLMTLYTSKTASMDMIHTYLHFLLASYDPLEQPRAKMIRQFVAWISSPQTSDDEKSSLIPTFDSWATIDKVWSNRCMLMISFYTWKMGKQVDTAWIQGQHDVLLSEHASVKCKC
jgi:hypothetical protein